MRYEGLFAAVMVFVAASYPAQAAEQGRTPQFSSAEEQTIGRNALLNGILAEDPWLVRQILDLVAKRAGRRDFDPFASPPDGIDPTANPDLGGGTRTAEGSMELFDLLKRARAEKEKRDTAPTGSRSAASSVEFLEMLRRAKGEKGSAK